MKTKAFLVALVIAFTTFFGAPAQASAATTGNSVTVSTNSQYDAWVDALYSSYRVQITRGKTAYNVQGFSVPNGWYCRSQWGYTYNGGWFGNAYMFSTSYNKLTLTCYRA